jgi:methylated-DNA-[protein]-cysteine S-methyltransferase
MNKLNAKAVFELVKQIPKGSVVTYKDIANKLGSKGYRAIGQILKRNTNPVSVPCHRVVRCDGKIGGYFGGFSDDKIDLLKSEGVNIKYEKGCCGVVGNYFSF